MTAPQTRRARHQWTEEPPVPDYVPNFTLDRQIAEAREQMGESRWQQLQAEWENGNAE
jgi:hypothetical protein